MSHLSHASVLPHPVVRMVNLVVHFLHGSLLSIGLIASVLFAGALIAGELPVTISKLLDAPESRVSDVESNPDPNLDRKMQMAAELIARRYRVAQPAIEDIVRTADQSARSAGLDPLLILAMIGIESRFNPYSESAFGAQGLMQIIGKFHTDKFDPSPDGYALLDPQTNIRVGVQILNEYLRSSGDLEAALKRYGGESDESGFGYASKVLAEKERLQLAIQRAGKA